MEKEVENQEEENEEVENPFGEVFAAWTFPRFVKHERSRWWYLIAGLVVIGLLTYALISRNFLFSLIIIIGTGIFLILERREVDEASIAITEDGIVLDDTLWTYENLRNFWVIYEPPTVKTLYLQPRNMLKGRMSIPLQDQNPVIIRRVLLTYLPEDLEREEESFTDFISRILKL